MTNSRQNNSETPSVSIEEALQLYLAAALPQGMPDDIDPELLLSRLKAYIAKDRPDWDQKFLKEADLTPQSIQTSYSKIKDAIVQQALKDDIPTDPEELYLYERRKEARANRLAKIEEAKASEKQVALVQNILQQKKERDEDKKAQQIAFLQNELKKQLALVLQKSPNKRHQLSHDNQTISTEETTEKPASNLSLETLSDLSTSYPQEKIEGWNKVKWSPTKSLINKQVFKQSDLSDNQKDKLVALDTFHEMRKQNMSKRSDIIKPLQLKKTTYSIHKSKKKDKEKERQPNYFKNDLNSTMNNSIANHFEKSVQNRDVINFSNSPSDKTKSSEFNSTLSKTDQVILDVEKKSSKSLMNISFDNNSLSLDLNSKQLQMNVE